ncbi:hypothetical protein KTR66_20295 [Roseococcus sp. SDR]|uniref:hypothetical protein n=1 Tax=Roseococcus sp. SDR TaxID=2835532 RepID=UPI001BCE017C|nr:hypothetical protein [Roseococcus sp. SDR]MBS7792344.1 hypothetical protein [Roseococcus sp. SDR]MBV1847658.1 hypothetical protein [Roseococcus sp. SDR]
MRIAPVATPIRLAARALPSTAGFDARMGPLVGQPEAAVIRALDVPARSTKAGGPRFIEYERRRVVGTPAPAAWRWGSPFAGAFIETRDGRLTFALREGRVERFDRRGNDRLALPGDPST